MITTGVALLALLSSATAFVVAPPASGIWASRQRASKNGQILPLTPETAPAAAAPWQDGFRKVLGRNTLVLKASEEPAAGGSAVESASPRLPVDFIAVAKYIAGTAAEFGIIMGGLSLLQGGVLPRLGAKWAKATVFFTFGFLAMKSRTFGVLNARRPKVSTEKEEKSERRRPDWMPPPKVFPFIWITIGILRAVSSTLVWEALGNKLVTTPIAAMVLHLSVGDTWNHINNVEKRLGVAVPVVFLVWLSVANAAFRYYQALPKAGFIILPSVIWIAVANLLVQSIWRLNGKEPLYPAKKASP